MPYGTKKVGGGRVAVVNKKTGRVLGRHSSEEAAQRQITAVNIAEHQGEPGVPPVRKK